MKTSCVLGGGRQVGVLSGAASHDSQVASRDIRHFHGDGWNIPIFISLLTKTKSVFLPSFLLKDLAV